MFLKKTRYLPFAQFMYHAEFLYKHELDRGYNIRGYASLRISPAAAATFNLNVQVQLINRYV